MNIEVINGKSQPVLFATKLSTIQSADANQTGLVDRLGGDFADYVGLEVLIIALINSR